MKSYKEVYDREFFTRLVMKEQQQYVFPSITYNSMMLSGDYQRAIIKNDFVFADKKGNEHRIESTYLEEDSEYIFGFFYDVSGRTWFLVFHRNEYIGAEYDDGRRTKWHDDVGAFYDTDMSWKEVYHEEVKTWDEQFRDFCGKYSTCDCFYFGEKKEKFVAVKKVLQIGEVDPDCKAIKSDISFHGYEYVKKNNEDVINVKPVPKLFRFVVEADSLSDWNEKISQLYLSEVILPCINYFIMYQCICYLNYLIGTSYLLRIHREFLLEKTITERINTIEDSFLENKESFYVFGEFIDIAQEIVRCEDKTMSEDYLNEVYLSLKKRAEIKSMDMMNSWNQGSSYEPYFHHDIEEFHSGWEFINNVDGIKWEYYADDHERQLYIIVAAVMGEDGLYAVRYGRDGYKERIAIGQHRRIGNPDFTKEIKHSFLVRDNTIYGCDIIIPLEEMNRLQEVSIGSVIANARTLRRKLNKRDVFTLIPRKKQNQKEKEERRNTYGAELKSLISLPKNFQHTIQLSEQKEGCDIGAYNMREVRRGKDEALSIIGFYIKKEDDKMVLCPATRGMMDKYKKGVGYEFGKEDYTVFVKALNKYLDCCIKDITYPDATFLRNIFGVYFDDTRVKNVFARL